mmetsp:Transcript_47384/g.110443  ORF Transcript_47384/g.110443 Transcript_47384/m.110443 type:complete len:112 (+) Transcript_47384:611-946(+)
MPELCMREPAASVDPVRPWYEVPANDAGSFAKRWELPKKAMVGASEGALLRLNVDFILSTSDRIVDGLAAPDAMEPSGLAARAPGGSWPCDIQDGGGTVSNGRSAARLPPA